MNPPTSKPFALVEILSPADNIWGVLTAIENWKDVISGIEDLVVVKGDASNFGPGLVWDETRTMFGRSETEQMELVEVDAERYYMKSISESCGMAMEFYHIVKPAEAKVEHNGGGGQSSCTLEVHFASKSLTWSAWAFSWVGYLTRGMMRKVILQDLNDIKAAVENISQEG
mmetsp:Transcript_51599/g.154917  ORF Transcript_51599/g.154917 Transcript_51599/m.154917 type:complete len:171 (-) Transcript_51599:1672-2184(-)